MNKYEWINNHVKLIKSACITNNNTPERKLAIITRCILDIMYDELYPDTELKVVRTNDAKRFPLIHIKKDGDVGLDLPAVLPYRERYKDMRARAQYIDHCHNTFTPEEKSDFEIEQDMREEVIIWPGSRGVIPTGIRLEIPRGYWASIEARSSTSQSMLLCPKGVIDEGYRGELFAVLVNVGHDKVKIRHGDRFVQLILHKRHSKNLIVTEVDKISKSERGDSGFGSTGRSAISDKILESADNEGAEIAYNTCDLQILE